jgi:hypothetical protein
MKKVIGTIIVLIFSPFIVVGFISNFVTRAFNTGWNIAHNFTERLKNE